MKYVCIFVTFSFLFLTIKGEFEDPNYKEETDLEREIRQQKLYKERLWRDLYRNHDVDLPHNIISDERLHRRSEQTGNERVLPSLGNEAILQNSPDVKNSNITATVKPEKKHNIT